MRTHILALAVATLAGSAQAATYNFAYTFNTGELVTGSFTGSAAGSLVTILSDVTMKLNGVSFAGPLYAYGSTAAAGDGTQCGAFTCFTAPAVASANPALNNFLIANYAVPSGFPGTNYFYIIPWSGSPLGLGLQASFAGNYYNIFNGQYVPANWSLDAVTAGVPEPESWALLIAGFGLIGAAARRRRGLATVAA